MATIKDRSRRRMWCRKAELMLESYILKELHEEKKYCLFPDGYKKGFRCHYFLFTRTAPLRNGEAGYDETHCCIRGLEILSLNLNTLYNLEYNSTNILTPIYVVSLAISTIAKHFAFVVISLINQVQCYHYFFRSRFYM